MSLDVYLEMPEPTRIDSKPKIFIRENGQTKEISREKWDMLHPNVEPATFIPNESYKVYSGNITHNLNTMAKAAGIYIHLWRPEEINIRTAKELIGPLSIGLSDLLSDPTKYKRFNPENGWGNYEVLVGFVKEYLEACRKWPDATVRVWR